MFSVGISSEIYPSEFRQIYPSIFRRKLVNLSVGISSENATTLQRNFFSRRDRTDDFFSSEIRHKWLIPTDFRRKSSVGIMLFSCSVIFSRTNNHKNQQQHILLYLIYKDALLIKWIKRRFIQSTNRWVLQALLRFKHLTSLWLSLHKVILSTFLHLWN